MDRVKKIVKSKVLVTKKLGETLIMTIQVYLVLIPGTKQH